MDSHTCFERLSRRITQQLAEDINAGRYQPGDRLPAERELARLMGVSRPVVREALGGLEAIGLVKSRVGSGTFVLHPREDNCMQIGEAPPFDVIETLMALECSAVASSALLKNESNLVYMDGQIACLRSATSFTDWHQILASIHCRLADFCDNSVLRSLIHQLWAVRLTAPAVVDLERRAWQTESVAIAGRLTAVVAAIRAGDSEVARRSLRACHQATFDALLAAFERVELGRAREVVSDLRRRFLPPP